MGSPLCILIVASNQEEVFGIIREIKSHGFSPLYQVIMNKEEWDVRIHEEDWDAILVSFRWNEKYAAMELLLDLQNKNLDIPFIVISQPEDNAQSLKLMHSGAADIIDSVTLFRLTHVLERERRELVFRREKEITQSYLEKSLREIQFQNFAVDQANIVSITDANGIITYVNEKFVQISGFSEEELIGSSHRILKSQDRPKEDWENLWQTIRQGKVWKGEIKNVKKNGTPYWVETTIVPFEDDDGTIFQYIAINHDITDRKLAEGQLTHDAFYDNLTELPNRALFLARIEQRIFEYNTNSSGYPIVISANVDNFRRINHSLGSDAGDDILRIFADRISKYCGMSATTTRLTADSFAVLVVDFLSIDEGYNFAVRLQEHLKEIIPYKGYEIYLTASFGIAGFGMGGKEAEEILKNAEIAMFHTKENKVGSVFPFSEDMKEKIHHQLEIQNDLRKAIERHEFLVFYQPILDLSTNQIGHWEALVRWRHPKKGMVSPVDFIPMAENSGLILPLTKFVLEETGQFIKATQLTTNIPIVVAVNLSSQVFHHQNIFHWIVDIQKRLEIPFHSFQVEITESLAMKNMDETVPILENLRDIGVKIALDDFGTGYSSLAYLEKLPLSILKIDKAFLNNVSPGNKEAKLLVSIIHMAHDLGLKVVAEGVEELPQFNLLREYKCDMIQGYLIAKPLSSEDAKQFLEKFTGQIG
jgi:diguanylate cyclase (GGDEF)-like protein/PAS domain S-box-containing protein